MNQTTQLYYLYCVNAQCKVSIYRRMVEVQLPLTAENLIGTHSCQCCNMPLISSVDLEIQHTMAKVNSQPVKKMNYLYN
jgi:hypothetical protein